MKRILVYLLSALFAYWVNLAIIYFANKTGHTIVVEIIFCGLIAAGIGFRFADWIMDE